MNIKQMAWAIVVVGLLVAGSIFSAEAAGGRSGGFHSSGGAWHTGGHRGGGGFHGGGRWHGGTRVFIGGGVGWWGWPAWGWWGPGWWDAPYPYYTAPTVVVDPGSTEYIQPAPAPPQQTYWYYCQNARAYYPYVKECPGGWMQVVPQSAPPGQ